MPVSDRVERRIERILAAAIEVFLEMGYRNARLQDVVARSGGSMSTLYDAFGGKQGLALAIMKRSVARFGENVEALYDSELPPAQALPLAAEGMIAEILSPGLIVAHRIFIAEGISEPELRDWFMEHGVARPERRLAEYFVREKQSGRLMLDHPEVAANRFYMMVFGGVVILSTIGVIGTADVARVARETCEAVSIFLEGVLPRPEPAALQLAPAHPSE